MSRAYLLSSILCIAPCFADSFEEDIKEINLSDFFTEEELASIETPAPVVQTTNSKPSLEDLLVDSSGDSEVSKTFEETFGTIDIPDLLKSKKEKKEKKKPVNDLLVQNLKGILLLPLTSEVNPQGVPPFSGLQVKDMEVPGGLEYLKGFIEPYFIGKPLTSEGVVQLKQAIQLYYQNEGYPLVSVEVPEQDVSNDVLQLVIIESTLSRIIFEGNKYYTNKLLRSYLRINPGDVIESAPLITDLAWMNKSSSFRRSQIVFSPGIEPYTTTLEVSTQEYRPYRFYTGTDNAGNRFIGDGRIFAGFNWGKPFGLDHLLSYQLTESIQFPRLTSHSLSYSAYTSWRHQISVSAAYTKTHSKIPHFYSDAIYATGSLRYSIPITYSDETHTKDFAFGFDVYNTTSTIDYIFQNALFYNNRRTKFPAFRGVLNTTHLVVSYSSFDNWGSDKLSFNAQFLGSPAQFLPHQTHALYEKFQPYSLPYFYFGQVTANYEHDFDSGCVMTHQLRGQGADRILPSLDQFGLGGNATVRGYAESELAVDNTVIYNLEFHFPAFNLIKMKGNVKDNWVFLVFADYGYGFMYHPPVPLKHHYNLYGVGPGVRYGISDWLYMRLDLGFKLHMLDDGYKKRKRLHFALTGSF